MRYDVAIVGAGPAGSAAARLLASWKHRVVLVERATRGAALAESIPPSCHKLFTACGVAAAIESAGFLRSTGNTVWWGSDEPRRERFADGARGYQIDRAAFDALLRSQAVAAGAELREGLVRDVEPSNEGARVHVDGSELPGDSAIGARFVLDCTGRAGVIARRGWRTVVDAHPRTVALTAIWRSDAGWHGVESTHTLVESYADGWAWSVPLSASIRYVTAMVDPQRTQLARGQGSTEVYRSELQKTRHLKALVHDARFEGGPWGFDASVYSAHTFASDPVLLVGDAASFVDPLSSYGVKKALASAWLAAVAVRTALDTPAMTATALAFHDAREKEMVASLLRQSRAMFEDASSVHAQQFWTDRSTALDLPAVTEPDVRELRNDPRVQRAFAWLKSQEAVKLRAGVSAKREPHPIVRGHRIVMEDRLASEAYPRGLRFLRDVDLLGILDVTTLNDQVPALFEAYNRRFPPVALPDFLGALSVAIAFGLVETN